MNAPFHDGGTEDRRLMTTFLERAAGALRNGGVCWMVANRHLPYEAAMAPLFASVLPIADARGFKVFQAKVERVGTPARRNSGARDQNEGRGTRRADDVRGKTRDTSSDGAFDLAAFLAREGLDPKTMREPATRKSSPNKSASNKSASNKWQRRSPPAAADRAPNGCPET